MNFLVDESVDRQIVEALRLKGYIVGYIAEMEPGVSDDAVMDLANKEGALLLTSDKDFGELVFRLRRLSSGIILIRLFGLRSSKKSEIVVSLIEKYFRELTGKFSVISATGIRIRHQNILTEHK
ncbi:MAG: DUF5615 family PIN-like protein [Deltaproteobacteria bacterium]|nr:DUF5615 family PIN-like protein [Deltaproteobacteria bacterium]